jgi:flagellar M-ring protein FliF
MREQYQQMYANRVSDLLKIPGLSVSVTFGLNDQTVRRRSRTFDREKSFTLDSEILERTKESNGGAGAPAGEPGAQPNAAMSINGAAIAAAPPEASSTENESKTKSETFPSDVVEESVKTAGLGVPTGAALLVPRSHVINVLNKGKPNAPEPDDQQIEAWFARELPKYTQVVKSAVGLASANDVSMALYTDLIPPAPAGDAAPARPGGISTASITAMAGTHSREIMLGGLALISLFMVSMMVRRGGPASVAVAAGGSQTMPMPVLDASEQLAGEVSEGKSMLDAMELDEDAVRAQQMVDQVAAMVEDNPDAAASLVKRWMSRT